MLKQLTVAARRQSSVSQITKGAEMAWLQTNGTCIPCSTFFHPAATCLPRDAIHLPFVAQTGTVSLPTTSHHYPSRAQTHILPLRHILLPRATHSCAATHTAIRVTNITLLPDMQWCQLTNSRCACCQRRQRRALEIDPNVDGGILGHSSSPNIMPPVIEGCNCQPTRAL